MPTALSARVYAGPLLVTLGYVLFYYLTMVNVLRVKRVISADFKKRGEPFDRYASRDKRMLAADRVQLNTLEHMPTFLLLLWLDAGFVSTAHATLGGGAYLLTRCIYPFVVGRQIGGDAPRRVMPVTFTGYVVIAFFSVDLLLQLMRA